MMNSKISAATCPQCGGPVNLSANKCEYCGVQFFVTNLAYLDRFDKKGINNYITHYKQLLKDEPDNGELNCAMGICYLDLGLHDLAIKNFDKAIEQIPDYADVYYYYAIAHMKGKRPKVLTLPEIRKVEDYLNAAIQIDDRKSKYYYLWAIIKYDFYIKNGFRITSPTFEELISEANNRSYEQVEVEKMLERVPVNDLGLLNVLKRTERR